jgi:integrase
VRRPHPRYDKTRKAWVTKAGRPLKTLATGPKNAETEAAAWDAFYVHMAKLGQPVEGASAPMITLGELSNRYGEWMEREVAVNRMKPRTRDHYRDHLQSFLDAVGGRRPALGITPHEVEMYKTSWHSIQTVQRLYNWGVEMGLVEKNPFARIKKPEVGERERILTPTETARLLRAADRHFRPFLLARRHTIARPQEIRALRWKHLTYEPAPMFVLKDFKGKKRRKDKTAVRMVSLDDRILRLLTRIARKRKPQSEGFVFLNRNRKPWTGNAVRCRMRAPRKKRGFSPDENGEQVVAYTMRHTSATRATANGIRDKVLAELMGHTNTRTTQRYQHLQAKHLSDAIRQANRKLAQWRKTPLVFVAVKGRGGGEDNCLPLGIVCNLAINATQSSARIRYACRFLVADRSTFGRSPARGWPTVNHWMTVS